MPRDTIVLEHSAKDDVSVYRPGRPIQQSLVIRYLPLARDDESKTTNRLKQLIATMIDVRDEVVSWEGPHAASSLSVNHDRPHAYEYQVFCFVHGIDVGTIDILHTKAKVILRNKLNEWLQPTQSTDRWYWPAARAVHPVVREMRAACKDVGLSVEEEQP